MRGSVVHNGGRDHGNVNTRSCFCGSSVRDAGSCVASASGCQGFIAGVCRNENPGRDVTDARVQDDEGDVEYAPVNIFKRRYATRSASQNKNITSEEGGTIGPLHSTGKHKSVYDRLPDDYINTDNAYEELENLFANHRQLQREDIYNMIFVFEEPTKKYLDENKASQLTQLGRYHKKRIKLAAAIHVVFPSDAQFYSLKHGKGAHHQDQWSNFSLHISRMKKFKIAIRVYSPTRSHWGDFLTLLNGPDAEFAMFIKWDALRNLRLAVKAATKQVGDQRHKSGTSRDYGFCGSQNSSADGSATGIPAPRMKAGSTEPAVQEAMVAITEAALRIDPNVFDQVDARAFNEFAQKIHPKNKLTSGRESETSPGSCCGIHDDQSTNSRVMTRVFGVSVIQNGIRHSFNAQHKHSVDAYCHRVADSMTLMTQIQDFVRQCDPRRKGVSADLFTGDSVEFIPGISCIVNQANLDPKSFGQTNLDSMLRLCLEFSLSLPEVVSVLLGMEMVPNQTYLSQIAATILIQSPVGEKCEFPRGSPFGRLFAKPLREVMLSYKGEQGFRRYSLYHPREIPNVDTWEKTVELRLHAIVNFWKDYENKPSKQMCISSMKKFTAELIRTNEGTGCLASNHATLIMGMLGLLPAWTIDFAVITAKAKPIEWINENFSMEKPLKGAELDRFVANLSRSLQAICPNLIFSLRTMENIICEAYRHFSSQLRGRVTFNDTLQPDQWAYVYEQERVTYVTQHGVKGDFGAAILERLPYGERLLTIPEIMHACILHRFGRRDQSLPSDAYKKRARFALNFDLPTLQRIPKEYARLRLADVKRNW